MQQLHQEILLAPNLRYPLYFYIEPPVQLLETLWLTG